MGHVPLATGDHSRPTDSPPLRVTGSGAPPKTKKYRGGKALGGGKAISGLWEGSIAPLQDIKICSANLAAKWRNAVLPVW